MNYKPALVSLVCLTILSGCVDRFGDNLAESITAVVSDSASISVSAASFYVSKGQWPDNIQELEAYCANDPNNPCPPVNWQIYSAIKFEKLEDGNLKIHFASEGSDWTTVLSPPIRQNNTVDSCNDTSEKLEEPRSL